MPQKRQKALMQGMRDGTLQGLTSCELATYGVDIPRLEVIIMLRPTLSRTLFFQMIGRGLRPSPGKPDCVILDHVGNLQEHGHPLEPYDWQFHGREKRTGEKGVARATLNLCPVCFLYYEGDTCPNCGGQRKVKKRTDIEEVDGRLVEVKGPIDLKKLPADKQREYEDKVNELIERCQLQPDGDGMYKIDESAVSELIMIAEGFGHQPMWVYHRVNQNMHTVNVPLLHAIASVKGYATGWAWHKRKELQGRNTGIGKMLT